MPHVAQAQQQNPNIFQTGKKNSLFGGKVLWSSAGPDPRLFLCVIIIYSQCIDNAPTQTVQGISHSACVDAAVPQIVQTTGPITHCQEGRGGKPITMQRRAYLKRCRWGQDTWFSGWICWFWQLRRIREPGTSKFKPQPPSTASVSGYFYKATGSFRMQLTEVDKVRSFIWTVSLCTGHLNPVFFSSPDLV